MTPLSDFFARSVVAWDMWVDGGLEAGAIARRQEARLRPLVAFARERSPFYRELYDGLSESGESLASLPPVTKTQLMGRFDDWVTNPEVTKTSVQAFIKNPALIGEDFLGRHAVWKSSGTSGNPGIFLHDHRALAVYDSLFAVRGWPQFLRGGSAYEFFARGGRTACIAATEGHYAGVSSWRRLMRCYPWLAAGMQILSVLLPLGELVEALNAQRPAALVAYPSVLTLLAHEQAARRLRLAPAFVLAGGECLDSPERRLVESAFGCKVHDVYACSEFNYIALGCSEGWLHVNADWAILEPVDAQYQSVPPGSASHTCLLTNLANYAQPIIRYDLGDSILMRADRCPCGSVLPALRVEGRRNQILCFRALDGSHVPIPPLAVASLLEEVSEVRRFQIIQTDQSALTVRLEAEPGTQVGTAWNLAKQRLSEYLATQGLCDVRILRATETPTADPVSGKFRQIWSTLERQNNTS